MNSRRFVASTLSLCALVLALVFAATAAAEVRTGEGSLPADESLPGEIDLVHASATYDSTTGAVTFTATTRSEPGAGPGYLQAVLFTPTGGECALPEPESEADPYPAFLLESEYGQQDAEWVNLESEGGPAGPEDLGPAAKSVEGSTTTLAAATSKAADRPYGCAVVGTSEGSFEAEKEIVFPIAAASPPPVVPTQPATTPQVTPAPTETKPAPGVLSLGSLKPLKLKSGKWSKVKVQLVNTGGTAIGPIALKAKAPAGVMLKPKTLKLPALLPGQAWTVAFQAELTAKAKPKSTISLTSTSGALTAAGSVVLKLAR